MENNGEPQTGSGEQPAPTGEHEQLRDAELRRIRWRSRVSRGLMRASALLIMMLVAGLFYVTSRAVEVNRQSGDVNRRAVEVNRQAVELGHLAGQLLAASGQLPTPPPPLCPINLENPPPVVPLVKTGLPMPKEPVPGQLRPPCQYKGQRLQGTKALRGGCWLVYANPSYINPDNLREPCADGFYEPPPENPEHKSDCFRPVGADSGKPLPNTIGK